MLRSFVPRSRPLTAPCYSLCLPPHCSPYSPTQVSPCSDSSSWYVPRVTLRSRPSLFPNCDKLRICEPPSTPILSFTTNPSHSHAHSFFCITILSFCYHSSRSCFRPALHRWHHRQRLPLDQHRRVVPCRRRQQRLRRRRHLRRLCRRLDYHVLLRPLALPHPRCRQRLRAAPAREPLLSPPALSSMLFLV